MAYNLQIKIKKNKRIQIKSSQIFSSNLDSFATHTLVHVAVEFGSALRRMQIGQTHNIMSCFQTAQHVETTVFPTGHKRNNLHFFYYSTKN